MTKEISLQEFLAPISKALGRDEVPQSVPRCDALDAMPRRVHIEGTLALTEAFCAAAEAMHVTVHRCAEGEVADVVAGIVAAGAAGAGAAGASEGASEGAKPQAVVPNDARVESLGLGAALQKAGAGCAAWDPQVDAQANRQLCLDAGFGITFPVLGVAETGSVVQLCDTNCGRSISLLPETHIAVIEADDILPQMSDVLAALKGAGEDTGGLPSQICFISGPSNTSDIELVRVEGVHGPMYVHYVIIETA